MNPNGNDLDEATRLLADKHLELEQKGYADGVIQGALKRSMNHAAQLVDGFPEGLRESAYVELLRKDLAKADQWAEGVTHQGEPQVEESPAD
jgi:hypothetical protein